MKTHNRAGSVLRRIIIMFVSIAAFFVLVPAEVKAEYRDPDTSERNDNYIKDTFNFSLSAGVNADKAGEDRNGYDFTCDLTGVDRIFFNESTSANYTENDCLNYLEKSLYITLSCNGGSYTYRASEWNAMKTISDYNFTMTDIHLECVAKNSVCVVCGKIHGAHVWAKNMLLYKDLPRVNTQPSDAIVNAGDTVSFTAAGKKINTYIWQKKVGDGYVNLSDGYDGVSCTYSGVNESTLTIGNVRGGNNGSVYRCYMLGMYDTELVSKEASLTVTDAVGPKVNISISDEGWTNKDVVISITADDEDSGLAVAPYSFDGGLNFGTESSFTVKDNGVINIVVMDGLGNITSLSKEINYIDKVPPGIDVSVDPSLEKVNKVSVRITANDGESGLPSEPYYYNNEWHSSPVFEVNKNGEYQVKVRDVCGNEAGKTVKVSNIKEEVKEENKPSGTPTETKPTETKPTETKPTETKPTETKPAETKPAETKPTETKPTETKPAETKPAETKPTETKPAETKPTETKPTETKPAENKPPLITQVETKPSGTKPGSEKTETSATSVKLPDSVTPTKTSSSKGGGNENSIRETTKDPYSDYNDSYLSSATAGAGGLVSSAITSPGSKNGMNTMGDGKVTVESKTEDKSITENKKKTASIKTAGDNTGNGNNPDGSMREQLNGREVIEKTNKEMLEDMDVNQGEVKSLTSSNNTAEGDSGYINEGEYASLYEEDGNTVLFIILGILGILILILLLLVLFFGVIGEYMDSETKQWKFLGFSFVYYLNSMWNISLKNMLTDHQSLRLKFGPLFVILFEGYSIRAKTGDDDNDYIDEDICQGMIVNTRQIRRRLI